MQFVIMIECQKEKKKSFACYLIMSPTDWTVPVMGWNDTTAVNKDQTRKSSLVKHSFGIML